MIDKKLKAAVSVTEMARMIGLSRARFYQLVQAGIFPPAARDVDTGRPFYTEQLQQACLEVRRGNIGVNGKPVIFYASRKTSPRSTTSAPRKKTRQHDDLISALESLGMASVTEAQVNTTLAELFPSGFTDRPEAEVIRAVFLHLRRSTGSGTGK